MKGFIRLTICSLFVVPLVWANGETLTIREEAQGAGRVDEKYLDELNVRDAAPERNSQTQKTRERMEDNPRNPAMVESFEEVSSKKEKEIKEKQEVRKKWR